MKKTFIILLTLSLTILSISSQVTTAHTSTIGTSTGSFRFFWFNTTVEITVDDPSLFDKPLPPGKPTEVNVTVKFKFDTPLLFPKFLIGTKLGKWIMFRDFNANMDAEINLKAVSTQNWCKVKLEQDKVKIKNMSTEFKEVKTKLEITIDKGTIALSKSMIKLQGNFTSKEKWGLQESGDSKEFPVTAGYDGTIAYTVENHTVKIPPLKTTNIPINITNKGNGNTSVKLDVSTEIENWSISFNQTEIILGLDETKTVYLNVTPNVKDFDNETIEIKLLPMLTEDTSLQGETVMFSLKLVNDGSLKETRGLQVDTTILTALIVILIVVLILIILLKRKKQ